MYSVPSEGAATTWITTSSWWCSDLPRCGDQLLTTGKESNRTGLDVPYEARSNQGHNPRDDDDVDRYCPDWAHCNWTWMAYGRRHGPPKYISKLQYRSHCGLHFLWLSSGRRRIQRPEIWPFRIGHNFSLLIRNDFWKTQLRIVEYADLLTGCFTPNRLERTPIDVASRFAKYRTNRYNPL